MSDFRRVITALAVLALLAGFASAQITPVQCTALPFPTALRAEGVTELIGDIQLTCSGPANTNETASIQVLLGPGAPAVTSGSKEILLAVNGNLAAGATLTGTAVGSTVSFSNVPVVIPTGTTQVVYTITNIRVNASAVGASTGFGSGQVQAIVNVLASPTPVTVTTPMPLTVGTVLSGLTFSARSLTGAAVGGSGATAVGDPGSLKQQQCNEAKSTLTGLALRYVQNFGNAFKLQGNASAQAAFPLSNFATTESGLTSVSQAASGTRLRAVFTGIPAGTSVFVGLNALAATSATGFTAVLVQGETFPNSASFTPIALPSTNTINSLPAFQLTVDSTGTAEAVWEVTAPSGTAGANLDFPVWFAAGAGAATAGQQGKVSGSFAPTTTVTTTAIPRFVPSTSSSNAIIFNICKTSLLFPFVSAANGFDTGIAIANTTADGGTTTPQAGTCSLNFFGASAPSAVTTQSLNGGDVFANVLSSLAPGYQGYIIATCNFQDAHGFAFVQSTVGYTPSTAAMGYLALTLPRLNAGEAFGF